MPRHSMKDALKNLNKVKQLVMIQRDIKKEGVFDKKITSLGDAKTLVMSIAEILKRHDVEVPTSPGEAIDFVKAKIQEYLESSKGEEEKRGFVNKILRFFLRKLNVAEK